MKPAPFDYAAPESLDAALSLLDEHGPDARILAGGQSLGPLLNLRLAQPRLVVDVNRIPGLDAIRRTGDGALEIGALARQRAAETSQDVASGWRLLTEAVRHIGHRTIRNRGTIGGSAAHADPAAELPAALVALDAAIEARSVAGTRTIPAPEFFTGPFSTALGGDEMVTAIRVPAPAARTSQAWLEFARRHGDFALIGVAAAVSWNEDRTARRVRLVYSGASWVPWSAPEEACRLVEGRPADPGAFAAAGAAAAEAADPPADVHATAGHRRRLIAVLTERALAACAGRVHGGAR